jgi:hypothetical protein
MARDENPAPAGDRARSARHLAPGILGGVRAVARAIVGVEAMRRAGIDRRPARTGAACRKKSMQRDKKQGRRRSMPSTTLPAPEIKIGLRLPVNYTLPRILARKCEPVHILCRKMPGVALAVSPELWPVFDARSWSREPGCGPTCCARLAREPVRRPGRTRTTAADPRPLR